jgi:hypothetical protein
MAEKDEKLKNQILNEFMIENLTKQYGTSKLIGDRTQLEAKLIVPRGQVSTKNMYHTAKDENGNKITEVVPFHTLFKERLYEDITTSNFDENMAWMEMDQLYLSELIEKICIMSGFPFKSDSLDLTDAANFFTDMTHLDCAIQKSRDGFGAKIIKSELSVGTSKQELYQTEVRPGGEKKKWWKFGR